MPKMKAAVFVEPGRIVLESRPVPDVGPLDALVRISATTICGTDGHIKRGEYPVRKGLVVGYEPVGIIEKLGSQVAGYHEGQRVIASAITPSGHSYACINHSSPIYARSEGASPLACLVYVDYPTQQRMPKASARWYAATIESVAEKVSP